MKIFFTRSRCNKRFGAVTNLYGTITLSFCHPERTQISYLAALTATTYVVLLKENHM